MRKDVKKSLKSWGTFVVALILSYGAGFLGSLLTIGETNGAWYNSIKPAITPPNWLFPIVWNILFLLIALSIWLAWIGSRDKENRRNIIMIYGANLLTNVFWSIFYFKLHNPLLAFVDLLIILYTIIAAMRLSWKINKMASWILWPYLLWVIFAGLLNFLSI